MQRSAIQANGEDVGVDALLADLADVSDGLSESIDVYLQDELSGEDREKICCHFI